MQAEQGQIHSAHVCKKLCQLYNVTLSTQVVDIAHLSFQADTSIWSKAAFVAWSLTPSQVLCRQACIYSFKHITALPGCSRSKHVTAVQEPVCTALADMSFVLSC